MAKTNAAQTAQASPAGTDGQVAGSADQADPQSWTSISPDGLAGSDVLSGQHLLGALPHGQAIAIYVAINLALLLGLAFLVVRHRIRAKSSIGTNGDPVLERVVRAHANAAEYIPAGLVGLVVLGLIGAPGWGVHAVGSLLTLGRIAHGVGLSMSSAPSTGRGIGMLATWGAYLLGVGLLLATAFFPPGC